VIRTLPGIARIAWTCAASLSLALAARFGLVEAAEFAAGCEAAPWDGACILRSALVQSFLDQRVGWFALASGVVATLLRRRWIATLSLVCGCAGLVLYSAGPAAPAVLLSAMVLVRPRPGR
jgi:hypothetical protein